jgi:UDP-N-acetylglucosamine:LPS N-acetylglucosamine transferase
MKVTLVCSSGGHLAQLYRLEPWWREHERLWVTFDTDDATSLLRDERAIWAHHPTTRNLPNAARNLRLAWRVLRDERPDVVVSDGAGVAVPFFVAAKLLRIRTVYLEVVDRVDSSTLTGRLVYPLTDLFFAQWREQVRLYPRAVDIGALL